MGQKVHPIGFRLGLTEPHKSQWFARFSKYKYSQSVLEDHMLRQTLKTTLNNLFLKPLSGAPKKTNRQNEDSEPMPTINKITIERKFIPYQVIITIHAQNCYLFRKKINNLKGNRELIAKMLKVRAFRFALRNQITNFKVRDKKSQDPVSQNQPLSLQERQLKERQKIRFIYRQRLAKAFVLSKKGNKIFCNLRKKPIYLPLKYQTLPFKGQVFRNHQQNRHLKHRKKKDQALKKRVSPALGKIWVTHYQNQTLINQESKVCAVERKKKNSFYKNSFRKQDVGLIKIKNSSKNIMTLRQIKSLSSKNFFKDPRFQKSKQLFQFQFQGSAHKNNKKTIKINKFQGSAHCRMKRRFLHIFLNKVNQRAGSQLTESFKDWRHERVKNANLAPFSFLQKWRFTHSPVFCSLLNNLATITKKTQFSSQKEDFSEVLTLLKKTQNYFVPLKKVLSLLKKKLKFKFQALKTEFIAFGSISKVNRFAFYQVSYYSQFLHKLLSKLESELTKIQNRQICYLKLANGIASQQNPTVTGEINQLLSIFSQFFQKNKQPKNLGDKGSGFLKSKNQSMSSKARIDKLSLERKSPFKSFAHHQSHCGFIDLSDGNQVAQLKKKVLSKKTITRLTRRMKMVEYIKDLIKKHRTKNLYFYLPIISEARKKIRENTRFIKLKLLKVFGPKVNSLLKENASATGVLDHSMKNKLTPHINKILKKTWNLKIEENIETICLIRLKSILQEHQRLKKTIEFQTKVRIIFFDIPEEIIKASFICENIVLKLEERKPFRQVIKKAQMSVMSAKKKGNIKGIKIQIAGRLNGAEIARTEWVKSGRVPLQSLSSNIDYSYRTAKTIYGIIGIKVWIFKGYKKRLGYIKIKK